MRQLAWVMEKISGYARPQYLQVYGPFAGPSYGI